MKSYAGIGSRKTPGKIQEIMRSLGAALSSDHVLRSGGASGADTAFYLGIPFDRRAAASEIYLPSKKFGLVDATMPGMIDSTTLPSWPAALRTVDTYHPASQNLSFFGRCLMARNVMQILGRDLDNLVDFVVCWTLDGKVTGGTGQALRIAEAFGIPVRNLGVAETRQAALECLSRAQQPLR
jgi:hypothetical protein